MCILGLDNPSKWPLISGAYNNLTSATVADKIKGHLVQIGTGEGKSVILGILSTVLALLGCEVCYPLSCRSLTMTKCKQQVSCACYSSYLSERDYHAFLDLFTSFGVDKHIRYSTLAQLVGDNINEQGDIRQFTNQFIEGIFLFAPGAATN